VEATSAEQIAADAGVTLRTFYRHFTSKHELLFADYDAGLHWFRRALAARPADEPIVESVRAAIFAFPYDVQAVTQIAALRAEALDPGRIVAHMRQVEADFAAAVAERLGLREGVEPARSLAVTVTARCIAAAVFGAMEFWMLGADRSLAELARLSHAALAAVAEGSSFRHY
jgi:AcrR family transcriptional regulator